MRPMITQVGPSDTKMESVEIKTVRPSGWQVIPMKSTEVKWVSQVSEAKWVASDTNEVSRSHVSGSSECERVWEQVRPSNTM